MPGPDWSNDAPADKAVIGANAYALLTDLHAAATVRSRPVVQTVQGWHTRLFAGCSVPDPSYVGNFRGAPGHPSLAGYEVGVGPARADGLPEGVGVWSHEVAGQVGVFFSALDQSLGVLDHRFPPGARPATEVDLREIVALAAIVHGEWIRIHPFVNGNGRTARVWAAFIALRYSLPVFVKVKPRPDGVLYMRAAAKSMGRPPDFIGDHTETIAVFANWLRLSTAP